MLGIGLSKQTARIDVASYNTLFGMIESTITGVSYFRQPVPANEKFAVTLRYLATGKQQSSLVFSK